MRNHIGVIRRITDTCLDNQENLEVYFHQQIDGFTFHDNRFPVRCLQIKEHRPRV